MAELPTKACWEAEDARIILANEALERNDPVFLATHSPIEEFRIGGSHASDVLARTEQGLLDALSAPGTRHAFCVVEGEPGSGKSHLIRWLSVRWPEEEPLRPLLIQRLDGSLQGTLQQLQRALPEEHQHLFDQIGRPQDLALAGRVRIFHTNLALALRSDHFVIPPQDADWCEQFKLAELIGDKALLDQWKAPERIIELLSGKKGERDQELARFNLQDIADLEQLSRPLKSPTPRAVRFKNELKKEAEAIRQLTRQELMNPNAQEELRRRFDFSYKLVDALNERHNNAVQNVLGISSDGLKELFLRLRRGLGERRLVLLLEDITAWEGVDRQLVDVLVTNVETRQQQDLCPMVSVVGVTPAYFHNKSFQANYRQRITHHIQLGDPSDTQNPQDVPALRTPNSQVSFAARYLRATRAGVKRLTEWNSSSEPVPNRCDNCLLRTSCHQEFGNYEGVGLFPFTSKAITTLYATLRDPQHTATYQTPRGMLQGVLSPTLQHPLSLDAGEYPGAEIETDLIPEDHRSLFEHGQMADVLAAKVDDDRTHERMRRLVAYWGIKGSAATQTLSDRDQALVYGGVRRGIYEAFGLPWLGEETPQGSVAGGEPSLEPKSPEPQAPSVPKSGAGTTGPSQSTVQGQGGSGRPRTPDGPRSMGAAQLLRARQDIARWIEGKNPERPNELNRLAYEVVARLNWGYLGITPWIRSRMFTEDTVILRDTKTARAQHLVLEREPWVKKGIEAYQALRTGTDGLQPQEAEAYRRAYAVMQRKLGAVASAKVEDRLPSIGDGAPWDVAATAAQVLLARAWLRGSISPVAETWQQWRTLICDEAVPLSSPQDRVESWNALVAATSGIHGALRTLLRVSLGLSEYQPNPDKESPETSLALVSSHLVKALRNLRQTFSTLPQPESTQGLGEKLSELRRLAEVSGDVGQRLRNILRYELERLVRLAKSVERMSRKASIRHHIQRVDGVIEAVSGYFPNQVAPQVQAWRAAKRALESQKLLANGADYAGTAIETFMDRISDGDVPSTDDPAHALSWALEAPASALLAASNGLQVAEATVADLLEYVEEYINSIGGSGGTMDTIHESGTRILAAADKAIYGLENPRDA